MPAATRGQKKNDVLSQKSQPAEPSLKTKELGWFFNNVADNPEKFILPSSDFPDNLSLITKQFYDFSKCTESEEGEFGPIDQLLVEGFDTEQVWEQMQLLNQPMMSYLESSIEQIKADPTPQQLKERAEKEKRNKLKKKSHLEAKKKQEQQTQFKNDVDMEMDDDDEEAFADRGNKTKTKLGKGGKKKGSVVDDEFFHLEDMNGFLMKADQNELKRNRRSENDDVIYDDDDDDYEDELGGLDLFAGTDNDDDENDDEKDDFDTMDAADLTFNDFFDAPEDMDNENDDKENDEDDNAFCAPDFESHFNEMEDESDQGEEDNEDEESDAEGEAGNKKKKEPMDLFAPVVDPAQAEMSVFEKSVENMKRTISDLEEKNLRDKKWQMSGETSAKKREENSLLGEDLDFQTTMKPAPEVTEEFTTNLEDVIKQRILDNVYDSVERKEAMPELDYKPKVVLDQEKSKLSLAEVYEKEYQHQVQGVPKTIDEEVNKQHDEISRMFKSLSTKLNALSNTHYTPKAPSEELVVISNAPTLEIEEVLPTSVATTQHLAPEEIVARERHEVKSTSEKTQADKNRERKMKKAQKRRKQKQYDNYIATKAQTSASAKNKYEKQTALKNIKTGKFKNTKVATENIANSKDVSSSSAFFSKLQQEVSNDISQKKSSGKKQKNSSNKSAQVML